MEGMTTAIATRGRKTRRGLDEHRYGRLLGKVMPVVIDTEDDYERMLAAFEQLMDKDEEQLTPEDGRLLRLLSILIEEYEDRNIPLPRSKPHKMVKYLLEEKGLKASDLTSMIGSEGRVSEMLVGKRSISKEQAKSLAAFFHVPVDLFI